MAATGTRNDQAFNNVTVSAGGSITVQNDGRSIWVLVIRVGSVVTAPSLQFAVTLSMDGVNFFAPASGWTLAAITTASTVQRTVFSNANISALGPIVEPWIKVTWTISGGSFNNAYADLLGMA